jgi:hypothetical protein
MNFLSTDKFVSVEHLALDNGSNYKQGYYADLSLSSVPVNIQPSSPEIAALYGGAYGKSYTMYTTQSGILETDRITVISGTKQFIVKGKQNFDYEPIQHSEYYIEEIL